MVSVVSVDSDMSTDWPGTPPMLHRDTTCRTEVGRAGLSGCISWAMHDRPAVWVKLNIFNKLAIRTCSLRYTPYYVMVFQFRLRHIVTKIEG